VEQHGEPADLGLDAFGYEKNGAKSLFERVSELFTDKGDLLFGDAGEAAANTVAGLPLPVIPAFGGHSGEMFLAERFYRWCECYGAVGGETDQATDGVGGASE